MKLVIFMAHMQKDLDEAPILLVDKSDISKVLSCRHWSLIKSMVPLLTILVDKSDISKVLSCRQKVVMKPPVPPPHVIG